MHIGTSVEVSFKGEIGRIRNERGVVKYTVKGTAGEGIELWAEVTEEYLTDLVEMAEDLHKQCDT